MKMNIKWLTFFIAVAVLVIPFYLPGGIGPTTIPAYAYEGEKIICEICGREVYPSEEIKAAGNRHYHKACFRCSVCGRQLSQQTHILSGGKIYCPEHRPAPSKAPVAGSVSMTTALNSPKKVSEGIGTVQNGSPTLKKPKLPLLPSPGNSTP